MLSLKEWILHRKITREYHYDRLEIKTKKRRTDMNPENTNNETEKTKESKIEEVEACGEVTMAVICLFMCLIYPFKMIYQYVKRLMNA